MLQLIQLANRAYDIAAGNVVRMYEVVREYARANRREKRPRRNLRRVTLPTTHPVSNNPAHTPPPPPPQALAGPLIERKRKPSDSPSPMSRAKRQDNGVDKSSPWSNEAWVLQHAEDIESYNEERKKRATLHNERMKKWKQRRPPIHHITWKPYRVERSPSPRILQPPRVSLFVRDPKSWTHMYDILEEPEKTESYRAAETMPEEAEPIHMSIDEDVLQASDFTPVKPSQSETKSGVPQVTTDEEPEKSEDANSEEDEWAWDKEGEDDYRKVLRNLPESRDEDGYKVPIFGTISPETQQWNEAHRRKLLREAAREQQTPSRRPKHLPVQSLPSPPTEDEIVPSIVVDADIEPPPEEKTNAVPASNQTPPEEEAAEGVSTASTIKETSDSVAVESKKESSPPALAVAETEPTTTPARVVKEEHKTPETALLSREIKNLSISSNDIRTPKSKIFKEWKSERITRTQILKAEREAAKNAYPIVELSQAWDNKVRHAVNYGHGRFEAKMFNKCVPEYSTDRSAGSLWLDDAVINDYVTMIAKHGSKDDRKSQVRSVSSLSSFFYTKISAPSPNFSSCAGMVKRAGIQGKNLLECEKVFIPINKSYHWTLAVIEPKVSEGQSPTEHKRTITIYNSMGSAGGQQVAGHILAWIQHELGASFKPDEWEIRPVGESPQQRNSDDCGVFTVTTARQIMLGKYESERYDAKIINLQRRRIVAELVNGGLLSREESAASE